LEFGDIPQHSNQPVIANLHLLKGKLCAIMFQHLRKEGLLEQSVTEFNRARDIFQSFSDKHPDIAETYYELAKLSYIQGKSDEALQCILRAEELQKRVYQISDSKNNCFHPAYFKTLIKKNYYLFLCQKETSRNTLNFCNEISEQIFSCYAQLKETAQYKEQDSLLIELYSLMSKIKFDKDEGYIRTALERFARYYDISLTDNSATVEKILTELIKQKFLPNELTYWINLNLIIDEQYNSQIYYQIFQQNNLINEELQKLHFASIKYICFFCSSSNNAPLAHI